MAAAFIAGCTPSAESARERLERSGLAVEVDTFVQAAADGNLATLKLFVATGLEVNRLHSVSGMSPLMAAAAAGRPDHVRLLIDKGASVWQRSRDRQTALMFAMRACRNDATTAALLQAGANPNAMDAKGETPLFKFLDSAAGAGCKQEVLSALLKAGARVNQPDASGASALERAVQLRDVPTVATLLSAGADPNHVDPRERQTALHWAAVGGNQEIVGMLLRAGANPNAIDAQGRTPAQWASGNAPIEWLLRSGRGEATRP